MFVGYFYLCWTALRCVVVCYELLSSATLMFIVLHCVVLHCYVGSGCTWTTQQLQLMTLSSLTVLETDHVLLCWGLIICVKEGKVMMIARDAGEGSK